MPAGEGEGGVGRVRHEYLPWDFTSILGSIRMVRIHGRNKALAKTEISGMCAQPAVFACSINT